MEIKITFKQTLKNIIEDRREYKQTRVHDYSVISTNVYLNDEYAKKMITEIDQQAETKREPQLPWQHRFLMFLVQHYALKVPLLRQETGSTIAQCNQRAQQLERLRPQP
eukprot:5759848-Amphidinium_carterae.3